jgi:glyoxylase I family protein
MAFDRELERHLLSLEELLLHPATRKDAGKLEALLCDDFVEFGSSGRVFDKNSIIAALNSEVAPVSYAAPDDREISEFKLLAVAEDIAVVTYRLSWRSAPNATAIRSLRSSIWRNMGGEWKIAFHQGTRAI